MPRLNMTRFTAATLTNSPLNGEWSNNVVSNNNFLPFGRNVLIKKIFVQIRSSVNGNNPLQDYSLRIRLLNKDGQPLKGYQGDILNQTSGVFNTFPIKSNDLRIYFDKNNPIQNYQNGILAGGFNYDTFSLKGYNTNNGTGAFARFTIFTVFYWEFA